VLRSIAYPDYPKSQIILDVRVRAVSGSEWVTEIYVKGTYDGPNNIIANKDYEIQWSADAGRLLESGSVTLLLSSGESIRQFWSSIITPENRPDQIAAVFKKFPKTGQIVTASVSPFKINKNAMSYTWNGVVKARPKPDKSMSAAR
jgi:hypothetical protein